LAFQVSKQFLKFNILHYITKYNKNNINSVNTRIEKTSVADPDADPDTAIFVSDLQEVNKKLFLFLGFFAYCFLKVHLHHFSKIRSHKEVTKQ